MWHYYWSGWILLQATVYFVVCLSLWIKQMSWTQLTTNYCVNCKIWKLCAHLIVPKPNRGYLLVHTPKSCFLYRFLTSLFSGSVFEILTMNAFLLCTNCNTAELVQQICLHDGTLSMLCFSFRNNYPRRSTSFILNKTPSFNQFGLFSVFYV